MTFHKVCAVFPLPGLRLLSMFSNGVTKLYEMAPLIARYPILDKLRDEDCFSSAAVDRGGYGVVWDDDADVSADEIWDNGCQVDTPFDGLMALSEASGLWGLSESTLRKAISYGKLRPGFDVRKFGKQWVISRAAMEREYGVPS